MSTKIYSVLIGVDVYDDAAITNLLCAAADAHAVAHRLRRLDATVVVVPAARLTGDAVFDHIDRAREALSSAGEDSLFIFYFAGHGKTWRSGALSDHLLLLPSARARTLNRPSLAGIPGILSWQSLMAQLADFPGRCLAILDACRSPLSVEGARDGDGIARFDGIEVLTRDFAPLLTNHGRIAPCTVINSCGQGQQAREVSGLGGVFSTLFNGVLDDAWDAGQRELRLDSQSFEQLLRPRMDRLYEEHRLPRTEQQAPLISGPPVVIPMRVDEPEAPHTAPPVDTANVREELLWEAACLENTVEAYKGYLRDTALATHGREALDKINALLEQGRQASAEEAARYTEAKRKAEEQEAKRKAEEAARRKAEQEREEDARRKAEAAAAKQQAEREAQEKARIESERKAREEEEVRRKAEAAARAAEAAAWARAESADTAEAWAGFVREYPQSPRRTEAEKRERAARERAAIASAPPAAASPVVPPAAPPTAAPPSGGSKLPWAIAGMAVLGLAVVVGRTLLSDNSPGEFTSAALPTATKGLEVDVAAEESRQVDVQSFEKPVNTLVGQHEEESRVDYPNQDHPTDNGSPTSVERATVPDLSVVQVDQADMSRGRSSARLIRSVSPLDISLGGLSLRNSIASLKADNRCRETEAPSFWEYAYDGAGTYKSRYECAINAFGVKIRADVQANSTSGINYIDFDKSGRGDTLALARKIRDAFGMPKYDVEAKWPGGGNASVTMCWGDCLLQQEDGSSWIGSRTDSGKENLPYVTVWWQKIHPMDDGTSLLSVVLADPQNR